MKSKILGLLAVGLLAGPMAANASYIYEVSIAEQTFNGTVYAADSFSFEAALLFTSVNNQSQSVTSLGDLNGYAPTSVRVCQTGSINGQPIMRLCASTSGLAPGSVAGFGITAAAPLVIGTNTVFGAGGLFATLGGGIGGGRDVAGTLNIREVNTSVPEPGTLALLGLGLAGLGLTRRRKAD